MPGDPAINNNNVCFQLKNNDHWGWSLKTHKLLTTITNLLFNGKRAMNLLNSSKYISSDF